MKKRLRKGRHSLKKKEAALTEEYYRVLWRKIKKRIERLEA